MRRKRTREKKKRTPKRGVYILPNLLTTASLFCGVYALICAFNHQYQHAALAILASFFLDGLDGRIARVTRTTSQFGVEYDSLADLVAFGVAPAALAFSWAMAPTGRFGWLAACLYIACGALRLARFNVQSEKKRSTHFSGLPIPAAAGLIVSIVLFGGEMGWAQGPPRGVLIGVLYLLSFLMVSNIPYPSFKDIPLLRRKPFHTLVGCVLLLAVILVYPPVTLLCMASAYVLSGPMGMIIGIRRAPVAEEQTEPYPGP